MSILKRYFRKVLISVLGKSVAVSLVFKLADYFSLDLLRLALNSKGVLNYSSPELSGEDFFVKTFLRNRFGQHVKELVLFDVGGNSGKYTTLLEDTFKQARIYTFEPNPNAFKILAENFSDLKSKIRLEPIGLSSVKETKTMTSYSNNPSSSHASLHQDVFSKFHHAANVVSIESDFSTLDDYCSVNNINHIDLLKIDTEGHELEVLKGGSTMLATGAISIIQFEFGECHVYSRVFLKDFYDLLLGFKFYRLGPDSLIPLGEHSPSNEIFQFQNIIAIHD